MACLRCQKHVTFKLGIICLNFGYTRWTTSTCKGAWCADCFIPHDLDSFKVTVPRDFYGASLAEVEDEIMFQKARSGYHLYCTFQYPEYQSHNIHGKGLTGGDVASDAFEVMSTRVTLGAFWAHSSCTVKGHLQEITFILKYAESLGIAIPSLVMGPYPRTHQLGMLQAIMVLMRSMELGQGGGTVLYGTTRKICAAFILLW